MKTQALFLMVSLGLVLSIPASAPAAADRLILNPVEAVVLPDGEEGESRVALRFDLSGLRAGEGRDIRAAVLDWTLPSVSDEGDYLFSASEVTSSWTAEGVGQGSAPAIGLTPVTHWEIGPAAHAQTGGLVRLHLRDLVSGWASGQVTNHGVVVSSSDVTEQVLASQFENAALVVFYTFAK